jgi:hypothetical protein
MIEDGATDLVDGALEAAEDGATDLVDGALEAAEEEVEMLGAAAADIGEAGVNIGGADAAVLGAGGAIGAGAIYKGAQALRAKNNEPLQNGATHQCVSNLKLKLSVCPQHNFTCYTCLIPFLCSLFPDLHVALVQSHITAGLQRGR